MISIAIDARMITSSGIGVYIRNLLPFLSHRYKLYLIGKPDELSIYCDNKNTTLIPVSANIYSLKEQLALYRKIPTCDIFWSPHYNIPVLPLNARKRIVTIHDTYHLAYWNTLSLPQKAFSKIFLKAAARLSDNVITVSNFSKQEIIKYTGCPDDKIQVIYNGIDTHLFYEYNDKELNEARASIEVPEKYILYVGNVKPHKNLTTLIQAFARFAESDKSYKLMIVGKKDGFITGDTKLTELLKSHVNLQERIIFTGFVADSDLPKFYNLASLFVFPSYYEGFGLPPLEAMSCGCPVLASNAASITEVCGMGALYFDPNDSSALKNLITKVIGDEEMIETLKALGRKQVSNFNWESAANAHITLFENSLE